MKTTIKFREVAEVLTEGSCYVCVDEGDNRENCIEDHLRSREMMAAAVSALGDYDVTGIVTTMDEPCFILRRRLIPPLPSDRRPLEGDGQK